MSTMGSTTNSVQQPFAGSTPTTQPPNSAEQPVAGSSSATQPPNSAEQPLIPIFEVAFHSGMWWSIPDSMSTVLYKKYTNDEDAGYTWDWGDTRSGSWKPDEEETSINRCVIDFRAWEQRNIDNNRRRSVRLVWVPAESVDPKWTGEIPR